MCCDLKRKEKKVLVEVFGRRNRWNKKTYVQYLRARRWRVPHEASDHHNDSERRGGEVRDRPIMENVGIAGESNGGERGQESKNEA